MVNMSRNPPTGCGGGMSKPASSAEAGSCGTPEFARRLPPKPPTSGTTASERTALVGSDPGPPAQECAQQVDRICRVLTVKSVP